MSCSRQPGESQKVAGTETRVFLSLLPRLGGEGAQRADEGAAWEQVIMLDELANAQPYLQVDHRYMNGPAIDQVFADEGSGTGNQVLWYLSDSQNTVRDVAKYTTVTTGGTAKIRNHLEYDSFGNVTSVDDPTTAANTSDGDLPGLQGSGTVNDFSPQRSYTGREPDAGTGLIYYRARWFDPQLGRFISEDPIGFAAGDANLSRYVENSTPNAVDPSGLDEILNPDGSVSSVRGSNSHRRQQGYNSIPTLPPEFLPPQNQQGIPYSRPDTKNRRISGATMMRELGIKTHTRVFDILVETDDYTKLKQGCMGLNKLRLNSDVEVFYIPGTRGFSTLQAALDAQLQMIQSNDRKTRIVISAYQDNY